MGVYAVLAVLLLSFNGILCRQNKSFKIGFLPAMSDKEETTYRNKGSTYVGAIGVALNTLQNSSEYRNYNFSYEYTVIVKADIFF